MDVDLVVLDIDGVLVDTSNSYDRAILDTLEKVLGETIDHDAIRAFKNAGGFNNDWDVTDAAALYLLARQAGLDLKIDTVTDRIETRGGGLSAATDVISDELTSSTRERVWDRWDRERLRRTFQWLYLGNDRYQEMEAADPPPDPPESTGYINDEPILLKEETAAYLSSTYRLGILTGRPADEAVIALDRLPLNIPDTMRMTMDDWSGGKPDPEGLITLAERGEATAVVFVGDELDDVRTARNATAADESRSYAGIGVRSGRVHGVAGRERFEDAGAVASIATINELPALLESGLPQSKQ